MGKILELIKLGISYITKHNQQPELKNNPPEIESPKTIRDVKVTTIGGKENKNEFNLTNHTFYVVIQGKKYPKKIEDIPNMIFDLAKDQYKPTYQGKKIKAFNEDIYESFNEFDKTIERIENSIFKMVKPYLDDNYISIIKTAIYIQQLISSNRISDANQIKNDIEGIDERKLCNLYLKNYFDGLFTENFEKLKNDSGNADELSTLCNELLKELINDYGEKIFIVDSFDETPKQIAQKVKASMDKRLPEICIDHDGIVMNDPYFIQEIYDEINEINTINKMGYKLDYNLENNPFNIKLSVEDDYIEE